MNSPFSVEQAHDSSGFLLWQVTVLWQRQIASALRPHGLTQVQFVLLASTLWLSQSESSITQVRLAKHAKLDIMMTSQVLRTLERKGWLMRELHPTDSRAKIITLTEQGIEIARIAIPVVEQIDRDFFASQTLSQHEFNLALQQLIIQGE